MDPLVTSTLISTGANILGGALGGGQKRPRYRDALQAQMYATENDFNTRMKMAKKHGIHPSLALGVQPTQAPEGFIAGTNSKMDNIFSSLGQGVSRAVEAGASKEERLMARTSAALELENKRLQNERLTSEIALMNHSRVPGLAANPSTLHMPGQGDVVTIPKEIIANTGPFEKGVAPAHQSIRWNGKDRIRTMSTALADGGLDDGPAQWYYQLSRTVPDMIVGDVKSKARVVRDAAKKSWSDRSQWFKSDRWIWNQYK